MPHNGNEIVASNHVVIERIGPAIDRDCELPHHRLDAWWAVAQLVLLVRAAGIADAHLRQQARRACASAATNVVQAAAQTNTAERKHAFSIARGEAAEAAGAVETAGLLGEIPPERVRDVLRAASLAVKLLGGLAR